MKYRVVFAFWGLPNTEWHTEWMSMCKARQFIVASDQRGSVAIRRIEEENGEMF